MHFKAAPKRAEQRNMHFPKRILLRSSGGDQLTCLYEYKYVNKIMTAAPSAALIMCTTLYVYYADLIVIPQRLISVRAP